MTEPTYTGHCFCGEVQFKVTGPDMYACHCHCESCRRAAGAPFVTWATFARDKLAITSGTIVEHHSTPEVTRGHCGACGTSLTYEHADRAGQIDITLTSLDDASQIEPRAHIWIQDKVSWLCIDDDLPQYRTTASAGAVKH
jgi:hypothetical protein